MGASLLEEGKGITRQECLDNTLTRSAVGQRFQHQHEDMGVIGVDLEGKGTTTTTTTRLSVP